MKQYIGTKIIKAKPMSRLDYNTFRSWDLPLDENGSDDGYLVEYLDGGKPNTLEYSGYVSWSPKEQFDNAYKASGNLSFGDAITYLKQGCKVARNGWNGKGMFIYFVPPTSVHHLNHPNADFCGAHEDDLIIMDGYIAMKTVQNTVIPWLASQSDMLATDWTVL